MKPSINFRILENRHFGVTAYLKKTRAAAENSVVAERKTKHFHAKISE
jgi:hypothetical protein